VQRLPNGRTVAAEASVPDSIEDAYSQWTQGTAVSYGDGVIGCLPSGSYYLVRSELRPLDANRLLLGNIAVARPPEVAVLWDKLTGIEYKENQAPGLFAAVFGTEAGVMPELSQPLLGTGILNFTGQRYFAPHGEIFSNCGLWFFPFSSRIGDDHPEQHKDPVLIIPEDTFIIDARGPYLEAEERWKKNAHRIAQLLARGR